ncbi:phage tail sheath family protein [Terrimonas sp. NA20]|uniref:Phage tail sheath family protein n=1 Tax=Terrimonas ginsenosidimutans TaxID=2908004 RepID=A0ABS9KML1_9BACT|nr:phage tail sheath C-terminal domain-containing protein [Terrimonas ginsenosidimutans]MCG2613566.1 phage tail sheath family protein [Terrimonas ginsenosidimutans]
MAVYKTPGVYIEEVSRLPPSVESVETAFTAFIGYTPVAQRNDAGEVVVTSVELSSLAELQLHFGKPDQIRQVAVKADGSVETTNTAGFCLYHAVRLYFANGGARCCVISVGDLTGSAPELAALLKGLEEAGKSDRISLLNFPDALALADAGDYYSLCDQALAQCASLRSRILVADIFRQSKKWKDDVDLFRSSVTSDLKALQFGAVYFPRLKINLTALYNDDQIRISLASGEQKTLASLKQHYHPDNNALIAAIASYPVLFPASPAICGIYAQTDNARGVWKAPANIDINEVMGVELTIPTGEQDGLNIDPVSGKSINTIRFFTGRGNAIVWGARTLAGNDNEWRYVPVRRLFIMIEQSVERSVQWAVFEPNDANTWVKLKAQIENYLISLWRQGALQGSKPEHAFYVRVGLNSTMTANDILQGKLIIEMGLATVRPAEFIVLRVVLQLQVA